jgi:hypothetical protein
MAAIGADLIFVGFAVIVFMADPVRFVKFVRLVFWP